MKKYIFLFTTGIVVLSIIYVVKRNEGTKQKQQSSPDLLPFLIEVYQEQVWPVNHYVVKDTGITNPLQKEMLKTGKDTLLIFRANLEACGPCTEYFYTLLGAAQKRYGNVLILTNNQSSRLVSVFEEKYKVPSGCT